MIELTADTFHDAMRESVNIACVFHHGTIEPELASDLAGDDGGPFTWSHIDVAAAPGIGAMFGVTDRSTLMVMREGVVLHCGPLSASSRGETKAMLDRAAQVDMGEVHRRVAEARLGEDALFNRRACPTTWRTR